MRSKSATWFEVAVRYEKTSDDGEKKMISETYVVDALTCAEAESKVTTEMKEYISGEFTVSATKTAVFKEVFFSDDDVDDFWYKVKLSLLTINEKTGKEKRTNISYLSQAGSLKKCVVNIEAMMNTTLSDYDLISVQKTNVVDVFE